MLAHEDLRAAFESVLGEGDEVVVMQNGLWSFGHQLGVKADKVPDRVLQALMDALGPDRTLLLPAYTNSFARTRLFGVADSRPETGILVERALTSGRFARTLSPMDSYLVRGPRAEEVLAVHDATMWGRQSVMGWLWQVNARIVVLGEPWDQLCSFVHCVEEAKKVPYRYFKRFTGTRQLLDGSQEPCEATMFVRPWEVEAVWDYSGYRPVMGKNRSVKTAPRDDVFVESATTEAVFAACAELLDNDPYAFVVNKDAIKAWVHDLRAAEIAKMPPEAYPAPSLR